MKLPHGVEVPGDWYRKHMDDRILFRRKGQPYAAVHNPPPLKKWCVVVGDSIHWADDLMDGILLAESLIAERGLRRNGRPREDA